MEPRLTEFSYGYCVTEELSRTGEGVSLTAAPYFPSLYLEGKDGGGFDVKIGTALFLQFKLSEELTRRNAKETKLGLLEPTFFRFSLHRRDLSKQHKMLIDLENVAGNSVYYIAPAFANVLALNDAYAGPDGVVGQSVMFSPGDVGPLPDDKHHTIAFKSDEALGWFLSEPKPLRVINSRSAVAAIVKDTTAGSFSHDMAWLESLAAAIATMIQINYGKVMSATQIPKDSGLARGEFRPLERIAYLVRTYFGCEVFLVTRPR